jgi:hypothetical protein
MKTKRAVERPLALPATGQIAFAAFHESLEIYPEPERNEAVRGTRFRPGLSANGRQRRTRTSDGRAQYSSSSDQSPADVEGERNQEGGSDQI